MRPPADHAVHPLRERLRRIVCRLDICWTAVFFVFLLCVATATSVVTQRIIDSHVMATWLTLHNLRIAASIVRIEQGTAVVDRMAGAFTDMHLLNPLNMGTEEALKLACSTLDAYDKGSIVRAFVSISVTHMGMVGCIHGVADSGSLSTLTAFVSQNRTISGTYLVDSSTLKFVQPLVQMTEAPPDRRSTIEIIDLFLNSSRIFDLGRALYNGSITTYDKRAMWLTPPTMPHLLYYNFPTSIAARNLQLNQNLDDFVQVRTDGSRLLLGNSFKRTSGLSIAAFMPHTLRDPDPLVLATSWGQDSVNNNSIFQSTKYSQVEYLAASGINDPVMRAALKEIDLRVLLNDTCNETVNFHFKGACATVTALTLTTKTGCVLRLVYASSHEPIVGSYRWTTNGLNGVLLFSILLFTCLFWRFVNTQFSRPLVEIAALMMQNVETGRRTMFTTASTAWIRLKEVHQFMRAHNRAMRRLRQIELFIPAAVRNYFNRPFAQTQALFTDVSDQYSTETELEVLQQCNLATQTQSAVYIMMRSTPKMYVPTESLTRLLRTKDFGTAEDAAVTTVNTLATTKTGSTASAAATAATHSAVSTAMTTRSSGPFTSPATLEAFAEAVYELSAQHHGVVHRMCPDSCVIHFSKTARTMQSDLVNRMAWRDSREGTDRRRQQQERLLQDLESGIRSDARDAMAFVWSLQDFMHNPANQIDVDTCVLVDTTTFVCGQYRAKGSEHVLSVAMGRDVQRDLGPLLPALKVKVAMTEETARRLRAEWTGTLEPGVRQLPIEAISTDRAGSNKSVVVLYEALPGSVAGDLVWQRYSQYCFEGFTCMLRGDYAAALLAYSRIQEISDLEPGLLPICLEREAAISFVSGGASSVQVDRLMRECRRCVSLHIGRPYCRTRRLPPGMHVTRQPRQLPPPAAMVVVVGEGRGGSKPACCRPPAVPLPLPQERLAVSDAVAATTACPASQTRHVHFSQPPLQCNESSQRYLISSDVAGVRLRHVVGDPANNIRDVFRRKWVLSRSFRTANGAHPSNVYVTGLHASGAFCLASQLILRQVPSIVTRAIKNAPDGPLSATLCSAVPVCDPTEAQCAQLRVVVNTFCSLSHPNLLVPFSYSTAVEGVVVLLWPFYPSCSLRDLQRRHSRLKPVALAHFTLPVLTALAYLHAQKAVHGELSLDTIVVAADGTCRLLTRCAGHRNARELFAMPQTCYVSPAMAAGALPTPACDVFCYGLLCVEILSGGKVWKWAPVAEGRPQRSAEALKEVVTKAGPLFREAVVRGALQPDTDVLDLVPTGNLYRELITATVRACLSPDPARRPTVKQVCAVNKLFVSHNTTADS